MFGVYLLYYKILLFNELLKALALVKYWYKLAKIFCETLYLSSDPLALFSKYE